MQVQQFCPPAGVNDAAALVAQPVASGQRAGTPSYGPWKVFTFLCTSLDSKASFGVRRVFYAAGSDYPEIEYLRDSSGGIRVFTFLAAATRAARSASSPRLSNLDLHGRFVKKGSTVSYHGVRGVVAKVSRGRCCVEYVHFTGRPTGSHEWLVCESVQVVS